MLRPVHVDAAFLIFDKPHNLLAVPGRGPDKQDCLSARVQQQFADALVVHRLDMATSGLMVFARGVPAQRVLSRAFAERRVHKRYVAEVAGRVRPPPSDWAVIDLPLAADWPNRPRQRVDPGRGKPSRTHWRVLSVDARGDASRLELEPVTGRTHQLRVHLQAIGHPILGDALYGGPTGSQRAERLLLHASALGFDHPETGATCLFGSVAPFFSGSHANSRSDTRGVPPGR